MKEERESAKLLPLTVAFKAWTACFEGASTIDGHMFDDGCYQGWGRK